MATNNRRVAAYFPKEVDEAFKDFKIQNGFATEENPSQNDSKALIHILSEFLKVERLVVHSVSLPDNLVTTEQIEALRQEFESKLSELFSNSSQLTQRVESLEAKQSGSELSESLGNLPVDQEVPGQLSVLSDSDTTKTPEINDAQGYSELGMPEESIPSDLLKGLSARKLEKRLKGANRAQISKQREQSDFPSWSAEKDEDGIPWVYRDKKFYPFLKSATDRDS